MEFVYQYQYNTHKCTLFHESMEVGRFDIDSEFSMSVFLEDEYRGQGYARAMMKFLLETVNMDSTWPLYIDTDASNGFWDHCGMKENTNGNGYEKVIQVKDLVSFANKTT